MSIDELIQLMRTCNLAKVREELEKLEKDSKSKNKFKNHSASMRLLHLEKFYQAASQR